MSVLLAHRCSCSGRFDRLVRGRFPVTEAGYSLVHGGDVMHAPTIPISPVHFPKPAETAKTCLKASPYLAVRRLRCEWEQGILFLRGNLDSFYLKSVAQQTLARVNGTTPLVNEIVVAERPETNRPRTSGTLSKQGRTMPRRARSEPCWC